MAVRVVHEIAGSYDAVKFEMSSGDGILTLGVLGSPPETRILFKRLRWHEFTALYNCTSEMVGDAYLRLVEYTASPTVASYVAADKAGAKAYTELHHFRIFIEEHGCHDVYAESALAS